MVKKWNDNDVTLDSIKNQMIAVIGYGIRKSQANNLKDSGLNVVIGLRKDGNSRKIAQADGHKIMEVTRCCQSCGYNSYINSRYGTSRYL